jgi:hypothetical protein
VLGQQKDVLLRRHANEAAADQRPSHQVEGRVGLLLAELLDPENERLR